MAKVLGTLVPLLLAGMGFACLGRVCGLQWEIVPDDFVYACAGNRVTLPWTFKVTKEEAVLSVNWVHEGSVSSTLVATMVRANFVVATFAYSGRVKHVGNGGLTLEDLSSDDSGNYTIEVKVTAGGLYRSFQHTVYLQVGDSLMLKGGQLTASQDPKAWWDQSSRQWFIRLTCGPFTFVGQPPVDVVWTSPDGQTQASSGYESGHFYLFLVTPVQGGNYTCTIPSARLPDLCYREHDGNDRPVALPAARVTVDELKARLSMLEANQKTLRENNARMQEQVRNLEQSHDLEVQNETEFCQDKLKSLQSQMDQIENDHIDMVEKLESVYNKTMRAPEVDMSGPCHPNSHKTINDAWRSVSESSGRLHCDKNLDAGWYRFFLHGETARIPMNCVPESRCQTHASTWVDLQGQSVPEVGQQVRARACSHWSSDCCNWQSPITIRNCGPYFVYDITPLSNCQLAFCVEKYR